MLSMLLERLCNNITTAAPAIEQVLSDVCSMATLLSVLLGRLANRRQC